MSGINIDEVRKRLEEKRARKEAHQQIMKDHPVEPGKCCEMCVIVGCEQTAKCVCKPVKFAWFIGKGIVLCCADCAKKLREDNNNAQIHPVEPEQIIMTRGGRTRKRKRKSKRKKTRRKKRRKKTRRKRRRKRRR